MIRHGSLFLLFVLSSLFVAGCSSGNKKSEARDKVASQSGLLCDFVNGEKNRQIELELNIQMAKKCDVDKPYTISNYRSPAEVSGVLFCCRVKEMQNIKTAASSKAPAAATPAKGPADISNIKLEEGIDFGAE